MSISQIPSGWTITRSDERIVVQHVSGSFYAAAKEGESSAESILYMLADSLLSATLSPAHIEDEREACERWIRQQIGMPARIPMDWDGPFNRYTWAAWSARAALCPAHIEDGEEVEVVGRLLLCAPFSSEELGDTDVEWDAKVAERLQRELATNDDVSLPLMTVAQHQRIVAGLQSEIAKLGLELKDSDEYGEREELRANRYSSELVELRAALSAPPASVPAELTNVRCMCGDEYPHDSYGAGFIAGSGMCENCRAIRGADRKAMDELKAMSFDELLKLSEGKAPPAPAVPVGYCDDQVLDTIRHGRAFSVGITPAQHRREGENNALYTAPPAAGVPIAIASIENDTVVVTGIEDRPYKLLSGMKGRTGAALVNLYATPSASEQQRAVVMPERKAPFEGADGPPDWRPLKNAEVSGWNACVAEFLRLNPHLAKGEGV